MCRVKFKSITTTLLFMGFVLFASYASAKPSGRVVNGRDAQLSDPAADAVVAVGVTGERSAHDSFFCGGTLIAKTLVVTARHCLDSPPFTTDARKLVVFRGTGASLDLPLTNWQGVDVVKVKSIHRSPGDFSRAFLRGGDISLLRLEIPLPNTAPITYVHSGDDAWFDTRATGVTLFGWGATIDADPIAGTEAAGYPSKLQAADMPTVSTDTCVRKAHLPEVAVNYLCAGVVGVAKEGRSSCYGDSGGPLVATDPGVSFPDDQTQRRLIGVVSHGDAERCAGAYTRYTRVDQWSSWLDGFMSVDSNASSNTEPPVIASTKMLDKRMIKIALKPAVKGPAPVKVLVTFGKQSERLLQAGTIAKAGGLIGVPPTKNGKITLLLRAIDAAGNESAASFPRLIKTSVDKVKPQILSAHAVLIGETWVLSWKAPIDNDRVVGVGVEGRLIGSNSWVAIDEISCEKCWTSSIAKMPTRQVYDDLPKAIQFRVTPYDRAGNVGNSVVAQ